MEGFLYTSTLIKTALTEEKPNCTHVFIGYCHHRALLGVWCSFCGVQCCFCAKYFGTMTNRFNLVYLEHNAFSQHALDRPYALFCIAINPGLGVFFL